MAELLYFQSCKNLEKAASLKSKATKIFKGKNANYIRDEEALLNYYQLCCLGVLGLYASLEAMVHELHSRRRDKKVTIDGKQIDLNKLSEVGFDRKLTSIASQLSGKKSIWGTELMRKAKKIKDLRTNIQHWDQAVDENYYIKLPDNHPLKRLLEMDPVELAENARKILDHYSLKSKTEKVHSR